MSLFIAMGVTFGFSLVHIPNIELMTVTIFISGYLLGTKEGLLIGILAEGLFSLLNPLGMAAPPLFMAQTISMGLTGICGGLFHKISPAITNTWQHYISFGSIGAFLTLLFAGFTNFGYTLTIGFSWGKFLAGFIAGFPFIIIHILSNTAIFTLLLPSLLHLTIKHGWFVLNPVQKGNA